MVWREREAFEEKTRRALVLLRRKDAKIRALGEAAARRKLKVDARLAVGGGNGGNGGGGERGRDGRGNDGGEDEHSVVVRLEQCVQEREGQIDILLEEVSQMGCQSTAYRYTVKSRHCRRNHSGSTLRNRKPPIKSSHLFLAGETIKVYAKRPPCCGWWGWPRFRRGERERILSGSAPKRGC